MKFPPHQRTTPTAFSLLELLVVLAIMAVIALLSLPVYQMVRRSAKGVQCLQQTRQFGTALLAYSAEHSGLPWWNGKGSSTQTEGSTYPRFEYWARPYLGYTGVAQRLRCPLMRPEDRNKNLFNYAGNGALCQYYPKLTGIPVPASQVVLAGEAYYYEFFSSTVHLNRTLWGIGEREAGQSIEVIEKAGEGPGAQNHGTRQTKGMHLFFLDGHASLVHPASNDWRKEPTYGTASNGGYFYTSKQFELLVQ